MVSFTVFKGSESGQIKESRTTREVGPDEVLLRVTHSGVCGTDEHYRHTDMVLGHEGVGIVEVSLLTNSNLFYCLKNEQSLRVLLLTLHLASWIRSHIPCQGRPRRMGLRPLCLRFMCPMSNGTRKHLPQSTVLRPSGSRSRILRHLRNLEG